MKVYPLPALDEVYFQSSGPINRVLIFDAAGKLVLSETDVSGPGGSARSVNVSKLEQGLYFYRLQRNDGFVTGKLLIRR